MKIAFISAILFALVAGVLTFIFEGELTSLLITNVLLGVIAGKLMDGK